jgi:uncharacterized membrane protein YeaQ/YmgE (transglycosylase-associated protein family)
MRYAPVVGQFLAIRSVTMSILEFFLLLVVAGICGSIAQGIVGYSHGGCLVSIGLGFVGALLGTWLARAAGLPDLFVIEVGGQKFPIVWTIIGATLFSALIALVVRPRPVIY